ncbi:MAG: hypothetical protein IPL10_20555 [Bacteroidetes bacterium]|nr:hypothetical protein [Bacteroidota bacterium]
MHQNKTTNLIIDVRNNTGGSPEISNYLFSYLCNKPYYYFDYVGRKCKNTDSLKQYCSSPNDFMNVDTTKTVFRENLYCDKKDVGGMINKTKKEKLFR